MSPSVAETSYVTLSRNDVKKMTASVEMTGQLEAPIEKGQQVGKVIYSVDGKDVASQPLVALETVNEGSFFSKIIDMVKKFVYGLFN